MFRGDVVEGLLFSVSTLVAAAAPAARRYWITRNGRIRSVSGGQLFEAVLALFGRPENRPAVIHCKHGAHRAAQFEAICRMEYQALRRRSGFRELPRGSDAERFLRAYVLRQKGPAMAVLETAAT